MGNPAKRAATYDDVLASPEHLVAELVDGELHLSPRPASPHAFASSSLGSDVLGLFQRGRGGPGGWWILDEPELHLGHPDPRDRVLVPDIAGWRKERLPIYPSVAGFELAPDWVCEVISPGSARRDRVLKLALYGEAGVPWVWLVDPLARTLEVLQLQDSGHYLIAQSFADDAVVRARPFDAVELHPADWWPPAAE